jgi:hypothetical protein
MALRLDLVAGNTSLVLVERFQIHRVESALRYLRLDLVAGIRKKELWQRWHTRPGMSGAGR